MSRFSLAASERVLISHISSLPCRTPPKHASFGVCPLTAEGQQKHLAAITRIDVGAFSIFNEADPAEYIYTITAGTVKVYKLLGDSQRRFHGISFCRRFSRANP